MYQTFNLDRSRLLRLATVQPKGAKQFINPSVRRVINLHDQNSPEMVNVQLGFHYSDKSGEYGGLSAVRPSNKLTQNL
jgi:predicted esterase YcpF (UPF0227 family)